MPTRSLPLPDEYDPVKNYTKGKKLKKKKESAIVLGFLENG